MAQVAWPSAVGRGWPAREACRRTTLLLEVSKKLWAGEVRVSGEERWLLSEAPSLIPSTCMAAHHCL